MRRAFGPLEPAAVIPRNPTREPLQRGERRATVYFDVRSPILAATWHAPATGHPDGEALDVASLVLSGGRSSRLYRGLVYENPDIRTKVTLPRVIGAEEGVNYRTVPFRQEPDGRGDHMRAKVKTRRRA